MIAMEFRPLHPDFGAEVIGFDIDRTRIAELRDGHDRTAEVTSADLAASTLTLVDNPAECGGADGGAPRGEIGRRHRH